MKKSSAILALAIATLSSAASASVISSTIGVYGDMYGEGQAERHPRWNGQYGVTPECEFSGNSNGVMTYTEATGVWTVDTPATIAVETSRISSVTVAPVNGGELSKSDGTVIGGVTVDYVTSTKTGAGTMNIASDTVTVNGFASNSVQNFTLSLDGTATMDNTDSITNGIEESTSYYVQHEVTCLQ